MFTNTMGPQHRLLARHWLLRRFKQASITPLLKKTSLDRNVMKNYRPVSNLPFLSKILEKVMSRVLSEHRARNNLDIPLQSAYRQHHSTETALLKVHNDVLRALDRRECVFLVLLDLSAAFDTIDHHQLKSRLVWCLPLRATVA